MSIPSQKPITSPQTMHNMAPKSVWASSIVLEKEMDQAKAGKEKKKHADFLYCLR
jgi:hypothetical protein